MTYENYERLVEEGRERARAAGLTGEIPMMPDTTEVRDERTAPPERVIRTDDKARAEVAD